MWQSGSASCCAALVPEPRGNVVDQQRRARPLHRLHQRLGLVALYGFEGFGFLASCAARRAVKPMTTELEVEV